jgi:hypothetical protein
MTNTRHKEDNRMSINQVNMEEKLPEGLRLADDRHGFLVLIIGTLAIFVVFISLT